MIKTSSDVLFEDNLTKERDAMEKEVFCGLA